MRYSALALSILVIGSTVLSASAATGTTTTKPQVTKPVQKVITPTTKKPEAQKVTPVAPVKKVEKKVVTPAPAAPKVEPKKTTPAPKNTDTSKKYITGPKGGCYYLNAKGAKVYVAHSYCQKK